MLCINTWHASKVRSIDLLQSRSKKQRSIYNIRRIH